MKAQMKAAVTSLVVIAFCLAAVGGVTYSWFSDTEQSTIDVDTARIDIKSDFQAERVSGPSQFQVSTSGGSTDTSLVINNLAANCRVDLSFTTSYADHGEENYITSTKCKTVAQILPVNNNSQIRLTENDLRNIFIGSMSLYTLGVTTDSISREFVVFPTQPFVFSDSTTELDQSTILYTPSDYAYADSGDNIIAKNFKIVFKTTAYQDDYMDPSMLVCEGNSGKATITNDSRIVFADSLGSKFLNIKASFANVTENTEVRVEDKTAGDVMKIAVSDVGMVDDNTTGTVTMSLAFEEKNGKQASNYKVTCSTEDATILAAIDSYDNGKHYITLTFTMTSTSEYTISAE